MRYYKQIEGNYIIAIGTGGGGTEITEIEYDDILTIIHNQPQATETTDYRLKTDLTWEQYQVEPPVPDDNPPDNLQESAEYLLNHDMVELTNEDPDPDYFNEHETVPDYFG